MCLFALLAGMFPRFAFAIYWIARPTQVSLVFDGNLILPLLGLFFLPFTTLMYTILWSVGGLAGETGCGSAWPSCSTSPTTGAAPTAIATGFRATRETDASPASGRGSS